MRSTLALAVLSVAGLVAGNGHAVARAAAPDDAWPRAAGHATGDRYNPGEKRLTPAWAMKIRPQWTVRSASARCAYPAKPLIGANRLAVAAAYRISGYDATTGALRWRTPEVGRPVAAYTP